MEIKGTLFFALDITSILLCVATTTILFIRLKKNKEQKDKKAIQAALCMHFFLIIILFCQMLDSVSFN